MSGLAGVVERVNKLVSVRPLNARYTGEVGDVVVGRVREVGSKRWRVDVGGRQDGVLQLSSVNLTGGEQRRRTFEDQMAMRTFFREDDLLSAEVHTVFADGSLSLHARSLKYGRLVNGTTMTVPPGLIRRLKQHFVSLPCGVDVILGLNGRIWITESVPAVIGEENGGSGAGADRAALESINDAVEADAGIAVAVEKRKAFAASRIISAEGRERMARVRNSIDALAAARLSVTPESIMLVFAASVSAGLRAEELLRPDAGAACTTQVSAALEASRG